MKLKNEVYDILKWIALIALPALAVFVNTVLPVWNIENVDAIVTTINAVATFLGALLCVSTAKYNKENHEA